MNVYKGLAAAALAVAAFSAQAQDAKVDCNNQTAANTAQKPAKKEKPGFFETFAGDVVGGVVKDATKGLGGQVAREIKGAAGDAGKYVGTAANEVGKATTKVTKAGADAAKTGAQAAVGATKEVFTDCAKPEEAPVKNKPAAAATTPAPAEAASAPDAGQQNLEALKEGAAKAGNIFKGWLPK